LAVLLLIFYKPMSVESIVRYSHRSAGKITVLTVILGVLLFAVMFSFDTGYRGLLHATTTQDFAETSVFVLNSPPVWVQGPFEAPSSTPSNPTNQGGTVTWRATVEDPNGANEFFLLICKNDAGEDEDNLTLFDPGTSAPPDCQGGSSERWARSAATADNTEAVATFNVPEGRGVIPEENEWYAFICDNDPINPRCNVADIRQAPADDEGDPMPELGGASPFYVNYRPEFTVITAPTSTPPGSVATWSATASNPSDLASFGGPTDQVRLFVCRTSSFDASVPGCVGGASETYASSTLVASNPEANYEVEIPTPNTDYPAWVFIVDNHGLTAPLPAQSVYDPEVRVQGTQSDLSVANIAPTLQTDSVVLINHTGNVGENLEINVAEGETPGFTIEFITEDANSCETFDEEEEMVEVRVNIYRSGIGLGNCQEDSDYDANNCYPFEMVDNVSYENGVGWDLVCAPADGWSCGGPTETEKEWECTFPLWYVADPTDGSTTDEVQFPTENWVASIKVIDVDEAESAWTEGDDGKDVQSFLAFTLDENSIAFGQLESGDRNETLDRATPIIATGNTGLDQNLEGKPMCPEFDANDPPDYGCSGYDHTDSNDVPTDTIPPRFQHFAIGTSTPYASGTPLEDIAEGDPTFLPINVAKSTVVASPSFNTIGWGIEIPSQIVIAGNYTGENTFFALISNANNW